MDHKNTTLRLGNVVTDEAGIFYKVCAIFEDRIEGEYVGSANKTRTLKQWEPVVLTAAKLVAAGFKRGGATLSDCFYRIAIGGSTLAINPDNGVLWIFNPTGAHSFNSPVAMEYLHQVQNYYLALTGKELPI